MTATGSETVPGAVPGFAPATCRVRGVLDRIGDKWAIYVVDRLGQGPRRFSELLRGIDGVTARMLTVTLRGLERDGILTRTVHAAVPPRVDYQLTPLGADAAADDRPASRLGGRAPAGDRGGPGRLRRPLLPAAVRGGVRRGGLTQGATGSPASQAAPRAYSASTAGPRSPGMSGLTGYPACTCRYARCL